MIGPNIQMEKVLRAVAPITRGQIVKFTGVEDEVAPTAAATDVAIGVAQTDAAAGEEVNVALQGISEVIASAAFFQGAYLTSDASGHALTGAVGQNMIGVAMGGAGVAGQVTTVLISPSFQ